jgi:hypothetical protein
MCDDSRLTVIISAEELNRETATTDFDGKFGDEESLCEGGA